MISSGSTSTGEILDSTSGATEPAAAGVVSVLEGSVSTAGLASRYHPARALPALAALLRAVSPLPRPAWAATGLGGIRVSIEGTGMATETDEGGLFSLRGDFSGPVVVLFELADGSQSRIPATVPRGASVTLGDVKLDGTAQPRIDVHFAGVVIDTDCVAQTAEVASRFDPDGQRFAVDFTTTSVQDASGLPLPCLALRKGDLVEIDGTASPEGAIESGRLTSAGPRLALPQPPTVDPSLPPLGLPALQSPAPLGLPTPAIPELPLGP